MDEDDKHHVLKAEAGVFRVVAGSSNFIANTATIARESIVSPTTETIIQSPSATVSGQPSPPSPPVPPRSRQKGPGPSTPPGPKPIIVPPHFKMIFLAVLAITILAGVALIILASTWSSPTDLQKQTYAAMDFAWKAGLGAIFGLLGGKAIK
jgi:hypothetical protein